MMDLDERLIRDKALWFAKGKLPEILKISIPDGSFSHKKTYIVSIIEIDKPVENDLIDNDSSILDLDA